MRIEAAPDPMDELLCCVLEGNFGPLPKMLAEWPGPPPSASTWDVLLLRLPQPRGLRSEQKKSLDAFSAFLRTRAAHGFLLALGEALCSQPERAALPSLMRPPWSDMAKDALLAVGVSEPDKPNEAIFEWAKASARLAGAGWSSQSVFQRLTELDAGERLTAPQRQAIFSSWIATAQPPADSANDTGDETMRRQDASLDVLLGMRWIDAADWAEGLAERVASLAKHPRRATPNEALCVQVLLTRGEVDGASASAESIERGLRRLAQEATSHQSLWARAASVAGARRERRLIAQAVNAGGQTARAQCARENAAAKLADPEAAGPGEPGVKSRRL
jgi:hypothetical protein